MANAVGANNAQSNDVGVRDYFDVVLTRANRVIDVSVSAGVQAGLNVRVGGVASAGGTVNLFAFEKELTSNSQLRITQQLSVNLGAPVVGEGTIGVARSGRGNPTNAQMRNISSYRRFSRDDQGDFIFSIGGELFLGGRIDINFSELARPFTR